MRLLQRPQRVVGFGLALAGCSCRFAPNRHRATLHLRAWMRLLQRPQRVVGFGLLSQAQAGLAFLLKAPKIDGDPFPCVILYRSYSYGYFAAPCLWPARTRIPALRNHLRTGPRSSNATLKRPPKRKLKARAISFKSTTSIEPLRVSRSQSSSIRGMNTGTSCSDWLTCRPNVGTRRNGPSKMPLRLIPTMCRPG